MIKVESFIDFPLETYRQVGDLSQMEIIESLTDEQRKNLAVPVTDN